MSEIKETSDQAMFKQNQLLVAQNLRASHKIITKLEKSKASTETMVDRLPDSYFIVDAKGRILKGNNAAASLMGLEIEDLINQPISKLFSRESWNIFESKMKRLTGKTSPDESFELITDGESLPKRSYHWNLRRFEEISDRRGPLICAFGRDITQIREYEEQLSQIFSVIPLGITTIDEKGIIRGPYSAYTEYLLDIKSVSGTNIFDSVFAKALPYLSKSEQIGISELREIFGQEQLWFDLSKKRFPAEIFYPTTNNEERWLGITYHPIIANNIIVKMLLVIDDRTEVIKARKAKELQKNREEIMIQRIMDIQKCDEDTLVSAYEDLDSMLIRIETALRERDVRTFSNILHGIKGVVRTAGFSNFKEIAHSSEDKIQKLTDTKAEVPVKLLDDIYRAINDEWQELIKLRKMQTSGSDDVSSYQNFVQKSDKIKNLFAEFEKNLSAVPAAAKGAFSSLQNAIQNLTKLPLSFLEVKLISRGKKTAAHLDKRIEFSFDWDEDIFLDEKVLSRLNEVFMHLITNALDHGIESSEERKKAGKSAAGQIKICAKRQGDLVAFSVEDDGAGIDVEKVKSHALKKRVIDDKGLTKLSDHEIRQLIFKPGFSTSEQITDISGRGIGLDSVYQIILKLGPKPIEVLPGKPFGTKFSFLIKSE